MKNSKKSPKKSAPPKLSPIRKRFLADQAKAAFERQVRYRLSRNLPLPSPANKSQQREIDRQILARSERDDILIAKITKKRGLKPTKKILEQYKRQKSLKDKARRKTGLTSRAGKSNPKHPEREPRVYPIDFEFTPREGKQAAEFDPNIGQLQSMLEIEQNWPVFPHQLRNLRACIQVIFRDDIEQADEEEDAEPTWLIASGTYFADEPNLIDRMMEEVGAKLGQYRIAQLIALEIDAVTVEPLGPPRKGKKI